MSTITIAQSIKNNVHYVTIDLKTSKNKISKQYSEYFLNNPLLQKKSFDQVNRRFREWGEIRHRCDEKKH